NEPYYLKYGYKGPCFKLCIILCTHIQQNEFCRTNLLKIEIIGKIAVLNCRISACSIFILT
ncbi:hypothetical protein TNCT_577911, partial [Trichonephila clavata]